MNKLKVKERKFMKKRIVLSVVMCVVLLMESVTVFATNGTFDVEGLFAYVFESTQFVSGDKLFQDKFWGIASRGGKEKDLIVAELEAGTDKKTRYKMTLAISYTSKFDKEGVKVGRDNNYSFVKTKFDDKWHMVRDYD